MNSLLPGTVSLAVGHKPGGHLSLVGCVVDACVFRQRELPALEDAVSAGDPILRNK